ncbi:MAG TPA: PAS domain S-box protein [Pyrinomonadaceae bacterium]|nr:PAS domain S-box protein [Pyrinomonadaceae bacterium]
MSKQTENEQDHRELFDQASGIVFRLDLAGNFTFLNRPAELISGYSCEEARRMNITQMVAPELVELVRKQMGGKLRERFGAVYDIDIMMKDGRRVSLEVSARVIWREGRAVGIQGIAVPSVIRRQRCLDASFASELKFTQPPAAKIILS